MTTLAASAHVHSEWSWDSGSDWSSGGSTDPRVTARPIFEADGFVVEAERNPVIEVVDLRRFHKPKNARRSTE
jgi:hypothetical protein